MTDKSWLLNPKAIQAAKLCIREAEYERGVKLTLSHPDFLTLLEDYCELTESKALANAWHNLQAFSQKNSSNKVVALNKAHPVSSAESITVNGHHYPKYNAKGERFSGVYRGNPSYR